MAPFEYRNRELYCEEIPAETLAQQYGTPLWVYSKSHFVQRLKEIQTAFAEVDPVICYSVKANSCLGVLRLMHASGSSFDVVSGGELYRVQAAGGDTTKVVFAGVGKTESEIQYALQCGIMMFNVESEEEILLIAAVASSMGQTANIALRLNPDIDAKTHSKTTTGKKGNKFGMDAERADALCELVARTPCLRLSGIHMHLGSPIITTDPYQQGVLKATEIVRKFRKLGHDVRWINMGGGFGISYKGNEGPPASEFARVMVPEIKAAGCRLILEPGRYICGNSGVLLTRVIVTKREGGKLFVIQNGAMNDLVRPAMYDSFHKIWPVKPTVEIPFDAEQPISGCPPVDIVGPVCESGDYFAKDRPFPPVHRGDLLAVFSAGAYGMSMSSHYNSRPKAAEVMVDGTESQIIRRRETYADLVAHEQ